MLRHGFVIVLALGMLFGGFASPASAANAAKVNAALAARQAAAAQSAARKHHRHHHHKKPTAPVVVPTVK